MSATDSRQNQPAVRTTEQPAPTHTILMPDGGRRRIGVGYLGLGRAYEPVQLHGRAAAELVGAWRLLEGLAVIVANMPGGEAAQALLDEVKASLGPITGGEPASVLDAVAPLPPDPKRTTPAQLRELDRKAAKLALDFGAKLALQQAERNAETAAEKVGALAPKGAA